MNLIPEEFLTMLCVRTWRDIKLLKIYPGSGPPEDHQEELQRFLAVLDNIKAEQPVMIELGCYWALWTIIFGKRFEESQLIVVEGNATKLEVGLINLTLNDLKAEFYYNTIAVDSANLHNREFATEVEDIELDTLYTTHELDTVHLLHMDIQGAEFGIYKDVFDKLINDKIENVIMATHFEEQHREIFEKFSKLPNHEVSQILPGSDDGEICVKKIAK